MTKFTLGALFGVLTGALLLIGTLGGFIGGLVWGWKLFGDESDEQPTTTKETPS